MGGPSCTFLRGSRIGKRLNRFKGYGLSELGIGKEVIGWEWMGVDGSGWEWMGLNGD
jgi:hypothetical protein